MKNKIRFKSCPLCNKEWNNFRCWTCNIIYYTSTPEALYRYSFPWKDSNLIFDFYNNNCKIDIFIENTLKVKSKIELPWLDITISKQQLLKLLTFL
jgi:hypothetical protein